MPDSTNLIIIRHGETEWNSQGRLMNHLDSPLSVLGQEQACRISERMSGIAFDVLYSSDLGRAMATAQAIAGRCGMDIRVCPALREQSMGVFEGHTWPEIAEKFPVELARFRADPDYAVPGGESRRQYHHRTVECLEKIVQDHPGKRIVAVAHGGTLGIAIRHAVGLPPEAANPARVLNASFNAFDIVEGVWKLRTWGDVSHLE